MSERAQSAATRPPWLDEDTLAAVRPAVRQLLESSPGFRGLPVAEQQELARNMVRVASYMSNPDGLAKQELTASQEALDESGPHERGLAKALAGEVDAAKGKASEKIGTFAGSDFEAGSVQQGAGNFRKFIGAVDFPEFVGGLIQNVFQAIVDASIQQMNAYGELLKSVAQTVDQFAQDNISPNNARDWLVDRFPDDLYIDTSGGDGFDDAVGPRLALRNLDNEQKVLAQASEEFSPDKPITDLSDATQEARLVQAARMHMARSRQQLLSSMVILGINRIVVTDGAINAKVVFDFRASDQAQRSAAASLHDRQSSYNRNRSVAGAHFGWGGAASANTNIQRHVTTVSSSVAEDSESEQEMKAKLTGDVRVNFKSDYFPMEKLASPAMIAAIQGNSTPIDPNYLPSTRSSAGDAGSR